jgi:acetoin utilization deacetylase AcuC-like enzyme
MFERDPHVLYISTHQYPYYPGTGDVDEIGEQRGAGFTVNVPLEVGAVDEDYRLVFADVVLPVLRQFKPDLVLVSAGFDAHGRDPLGGMRLTTPAFAAMTMDLREVAEECCSGRIVVVTEGGYDFRALADCLRGVVDALAAEHPAAAEWPAAGSVPASRGRAATTAVKKLLAPYWQL